MRPDILVIGGGVAGASIAWQLAKHGKKVLVLERDMLGCGSTGRAAGLLGQLRSSEAATSMMIESLAIVKEMESRLDTNIFVKTGSLRLATTPERQKETLQHVEFGQSLGLDINLLDRTEAQKLLPYGQFNDVLASSYCPSDGHVMPAELLNGFVRLGRDEGVVFRTQTPVSEIVVRHGRVEGVQCADEFMACPIVVNAGGPWSYLLAELAGTTLQTCALGHYYLTTTDDVQHPIDRLSPAVRDYDNRIYSRPETGGLLVGIYEAEPDRYAMEDLPADFDMSGMSAARDNYSVALLMDAAQRRFPFLTDRVNFIVTHGIMTFTPNGSPLCGEIPEVEGLFHCSGFCGHGIVRSPVIGTIMADLILEGKERYDLKQLRADRYFDLEGYQSRADIIDKGVHSYAAHYGKQDPKLN
jgi:sarcosine dehydrogenase